MGEFKLNDELFELYGILIGDGCISKFESQGRTHYAIRIDGNSVTDYGYYSAYLKPLIQRLTGRKITVKHRKKGNCIFIMFEYKEFAHFLNRKLGFPYGKKGEIRINEKVLQNEDNLFAVLRGLFDTDGCLYFTKNNSQLRYYPIIEISTHSKALLNQLFKILTDLRLNVKISHFQDSVKLHGKENLIKFMQFIASNHPDKLSKYEYWQKYGCCPSNTELNFEERVKMVKMGL